MKPIIIIIALVAFVLTWSGVLSTQKAFALQHFFNCVTDAANKVGGDHNLSLQQVIACFKKEFPNNPGTSHFDKNLDTGSGVSIVNGHIHINDNALGGESASASASAG